MSLQRHLKARYLKLRRWRHRLTPAVLWDVFMLYLALLNVGLILFDITYLWLRPSYFSYVPALTQLYDPWVKGIEPHPLTLRYLEAVDAEEPQLPELRALARQVLEENPFERSGQSSNLERLTLRTRRFVAERDDVPFEQLESALAVDRLWSGASPDTFDFFQRELRPLLEVSYHREYNLDGEPVDRFWLLDLPFLLIFALEFCVRWLRAVRCRLYARWFFFPIFNWYDVLGILPMQEMRFFRLFRVASIYVRLYRSEHTSIGDDVLSRTVKYFSNIINEEISDRVSLRILNETQDEIRDGTHRRIIRAVTAPRRDVLAGEFTERLRQIVASTDARQRIRTFLDANLKRAVDSSEALNRLPLPNAVMRPLVEVIGGIVFEAIVETMAATLDTEEGQEAMNELMTAAIDGLVEELTEGELEALVRNISIEAIEHVKEAVRVRKWATASQATDGG
jgi:hypothetical protein